MREKSRPPGSSRVAGRGRLRRDWPRTLSAARIQRTERSRYGGPPSIHRGGGLDAADRKARKAPREGTREGEVDEAFSRRQRKHRTAPRSREAVPAPRTRQAPAADSGCSEPGMRAAQDRQEDNIIG